MFMIVNKRRHQYFMSYFFFSFEMISSLFMIDASFKFNKQCINVDKIFRFSRGISFNTRFVITPLDCFEMTM